MHAQQRQQLAPRDTCVFYQLAVVPSILSLLLIVNHLYTMMRFVASIMC